MKTLTINNKEIKLYDSIDEMPIINFQKYNKYVIIDSCIGSDIDSVDEHIVNLAKLIKTDMKKAQQELQNMRQNLHMIVSSISPQYLAFAALIHSVDGKVVTDLSDSNLTAILDDIKNIKHSVITDFLIWLKKKLQTELVLYFPAEFESAKEKDIYQKLKQKVIYELQEISDNVDNTKQIAEIDNYLFSLYKPKSFFGKDSVEITYDKQFETSCILISKETGLYIKNMTVLQYYNALELIKKEAEIKTKAYKRVKKH